MSAIESVTGGADAGATGAAPELTPVIQTGPTTEVVPAPVQAPAATPVAPAAQPVKEEGLPAVPAVGVQPEGEAVDPVVALMTQLQNLPVGQVDELLAQLEGVTGADAAEAAAADDDYLDDDGDPEGVMQVGASSESVEPRGPVRYADMGKGEQRALAAVHHHMMEEAVDKALDSNQDLSYNMEQAGKGARASVVSFVKDAMERQIAKEGDGFDYDWNRVAKIAFAQAAPRLAPFFEPRTPRAGMGPGEGSGIAQMATRTPVEPQRIPAYASAEDYAQYLTERMQYNAAMAEQELSDQVPLPGA